jgi:2-keto-4-pentenoate hydratase/2-oxohepta-3-ene-1,7-dioic acid hydratase in catechol pathway
MRIVRFTHDSDEHGTDRFGARLSNGMLLDASSWTLPTRTHELYEKNGEFLQCLEQAVEQAEAGVGRLPVVEERETRLLAPVERPGKVICVGLNYDDHALESSMALPEEPLIFSKFTTTINDPGAAIDLPRGSKEVDYEAELGVVIGRRTFECSKAEALDSVLGYTCVNDVSARDFQFADGQWQRGKSCDGFCPIGPEIVTADRIPDPQALTMTLMLNETVMQETHTSEMIFDVRTIIAYISGFATLEPGDVIATGTPPGCGFAMDPPVYLQSGDRMAVRISEIGELHNSIA